MLDTNAAAAKFNFSPLFSRLLVRKSFHTRCFSSTPDAVFLFVQAYTDCTLRGTALFI